MLPNPRCTATALHLSCTLVYCSVYVATTALHAPQLHCNCTFMHCTLHRTVYHSTKSLLLHSAQCMIIHALLCTFLLCNIGPPGPTQNPRHARHIASSVALQVNYHQPTLQLGCSPSSYVGHQLIGSRLLSTFMHFSTPQYWPSQILRLARHITTLVN